LVARWSFACPGQFMHMGTRINLSALSLTVLGSACLGPRCLPRSCCLGCAGSLLSASVVVPGARSVCPGRFHVQVSSWTWAPGMTSQPCRSLCLALPVWVPAVCLGRAARCRLLVCWAGTGRFHVQVSSWTWAPGMTSQLCRSLCLALPGWVPAVCLGRGARCRLLVCWAGTGRFHVQVSSWTWAPENGSAQASAHRLANSVFL